MYDIIASIASQDEKKDLFSTYKFFLREKCIDNIHIITWLNYQHFTHLFNELCKKNTIQYTHLLHILLVR